MAELSITVPDPSVPRVAHAVITRNGYQQGVGGLHEGWSDAECVSDWLVARLKKEVFADEYHDTNQSASDDAWVVVDGLGITET